MANGRVVFVAGRAGSGKGTLCSKLAEKPGFYHINVGGLLRVEKDNEENEDRELIARCMNAGNVVPAAVTCRLLDRAFDGILRNSNGDNTMFLVDGFPRDMDNRKEWDDTLAKKYEVLFMLVLNCSEETCRQRLLNRGRTSGREDDDESCIKKRFDAHKTLTEPVIHHFDSLGIVQMVDAEKLEDKVYEDAVKIFRSYQ